MTARAHLPARVAAHLPARVAAVLFDLDDTLVASEHAWFAATAALWAEAGGTPPAEGVLGGSVEHLVRAYVRDFPGADVAVVDARLRALLDRELAGGVRPLPGAGDLVSRLSSRLPVAVASNSPTAVVQRVVDAMGWRGFVTAALGTEDVDRPKPAPDLYLAAAEACGARAGDCVVFEDSPVGAQAARTAGAVVVTVGSAAVGHGHIDVESLRDPRVAQWEPEVLT